MARTFRDFWGVVHATYTMKDGRLGKRAYFLECTGEDLYNCKTQKEEMLTCLECIVTDRGPLRMATESSTLSKSATARAGTAASPTSSVRRMHFQAGSLTKSQRKSRV